MSIRDLPKAEIQKRIDRIRWFHEFDFGDGIARQGQDARRARDAGHA
jgi:hypothetical protein